MSIPCGMGDGLPIGMMLVGKRYAETTIYRAAYAFEQAEDWNQSLIVLQEHQREHGGTAR